VHINQDVKLYASVLGEGQSVTEDLAPGRHAWLQLISGALDVNGYTLTSGYGAAISEEAKLKITAMENETEFLLFDLN
jgi:redox-sensitive bicupin YhaK (pirin superfamily)